MSDSYVVKLVNDYELLVKLQGLGNVDVNDILEVMDQRTRDVRDPITGENLGSLDRPKARLLVERVGEKMCLCSAMGRSATSGLSAISRVMSGEPSILIRADEPRWPEGVEPGDPVRRTGRQLKPASGPPS